jgi:hypothetical protein
MHLQLDEVRTPPNLGDEARQTAASDGKDFGERA